MIDIFQTLCLLAALVWIFTQLLINKTVRERQSILFDMLLQLGANAKVENWNQKIKSLYGQAEVPTQANLVVTKSHNRTVEEIKKAVDTWITFQQLTGKVDSIAHSWVDGTCEATFSLHGISITGWIIVTPTQMVIKGTIPWVGIPWKSRIYDTVNKFADEILSGING